MKELKYNIALLKSRKEFYIGMICIFLLPFVHFVMNCQYLMNNGNYTGFAQLYRSAEFQMILTNVEMAFGPILVFGFPMLCHYMFGDSYYNENKQEYAVFLQPRLNHKKNVLSKLAVSMVVPFIVILSSLLLNYFLTVYVFGSNFNSDLIGLPVFHIWDQPFYFLDAVRFVAPMLYGVLICLSISFLSALLSGLAFSLSCFIKNKILNYFAIILVMILDMFVLQFFAPEYSTVVQMQVISHYTVFQYGVDCLLIVMMIGILMFIKLRKNDVYE